MKVKEEANKADAFAAAAKELRLRASGMCFGVQMKRAITVTKQCANCHSVCLKNKLKHYGPIIRRDMFTVFARRNDFLPALLTRTYFCHLWHLWHLLRRHGGQTGAPGEDGGGTHAGQGEPRGRDRAQERYVCSFGE
jgi:hypothetical protein